MSNNYFGITEELYFEDLEDGDDEYYSGDSSSTPNEGYFLQIGKNSNVNLSVTTVPSASLHMKCAMESQTVLMERMRRAATLTASLQVSSITHITLPCGFVKGGACGVPA